MRPIYRHHIIWSILEVAAIAAVVGLAIWWVIQGYLPVVAVVLGVILLALGVRSFLGEYHQHTHKR